VVFVCRRAQRKFFLVLKLPFPPTT
jgi:hypothetical protein